jgi:uncharacterized protein YegP (UPF0339 family)
MSAARFEIVRTLATQPYHVRFRAANGKVVWSTENYRRRPDAVRAIETLLDQGVVDGTIHRGPLRLTTEVRDVDERGAR